MSGATTLASFGAATRITARIGAELIGVDLRRTLSRGDAERLRSTLAQHHVIVVRDQHLSPDEHAALASSIGDIQASPVQRLTGSTTLVSTIEDTVERPPAGFPWHTDLSWTSAPPAIGLLCAVVIPAFGGDTLWTSTAAMFDSLSPDDRIRCETLSVLHAPDDSLLASVERHHGRALAERLRAEHPPIEHPLVRSHPLTGRRNLYLSPLYARRIVGPAGADGALLERLHRMLDEPEFQMRWRWRAGDVVLWDETATCHRALTDHHPQRRVVRRCVTAAW